jgi:hypothetical protein
LGLAEKDWAGRQAAARDWLLLPGGVSPFIKSMGLMLFFRHFEEPAVSVASQPLLNSQFMHRMMDDVVAS